MRDLTGQVALVTGAAGGIGSAICRRLAEDGVVLVAGYRSSPDAARALVAELPGADHVALAAAVEDSAALDRLAADVERRFGRLDILVNNAGITRFVPHPDLDSLTDELIDDIFRTNWRGAFACVRSFRRLLADGEGGLVINISSIAGITAMGSNIAYCASKAALNTMTMALARALAPAIRVVSVSPGVVDTPFTRSFDDAWRAEQSEKTPLKRLADPEEVADAVSMVARALSFTTGSIIPVDGGRPLT